MSLGLALTLIVMAVILLGAAMYAFLIPESIKLRKVNKKEASSQKVESK